MKLKLFANLINFKSSIFSLMFLLASSFLALSIPAIHENLTPKQAVFIISIGGSSAIFARIIGIVLNQFIDRSIDKKNPRTALRVLPSKQISESFAKVLVLICSILFLSLCKILNILSWGILSLILFTLYPYMKRISLLCHWVLGLVYTVAILMNFAALAQGGISRSLQLAALSWGICVGLVVTANDIIYAIQDAAFDRSEKLLSVPACLGETKSIQVASLCLICSFASYLFLGWLGSLNKAFYFLALFPLSAILFVLKTYKAIGKAKTGEENCFFFANVYIALSFLISMALLFLISL